jgi:hypothetical protein
LIIARRAVPSLYNRLAMKSPRPSKSTLNYAQRDTNSWFQCNQDTIHIYTSEPRWSSYVLWAIAAFFLFLPLVRTLVYGDEFLDSRGTWPARWFSLFIWLFVVFLCVSAGFQWSTVRIDLSVRRVTRTGRWGPFRGTVSEPLHKFDRVVLESESEGSLRVDLRGGEDECVLLLSEHSWRESVHVAQEVASRLGLPLEGYDPDDEWPD